MKKETTHTEASEGAISTLLSMQTSIFAALGCTEINYRSPLKLEKAAEQIARFAKASDEYRTMLAVLQEISILDQKNTTSLPWDLILKIRAAIAKAEAR